MSSKRAASNQVRAIAAAAFSRGLVKPEALWDAACRWTLGGCPSARDLFEDIIDPASLEELLREHTGQDAGLEPRAAPSAPSALAIGTTIAGAPVALSKRTFAYAAALRDGAAVATVPSVTSYSLGIRHNF